MTFLLLFSFNSLPSSLLINFVLNPPETLFFKKIQLFPFVGIIASPIQRTTTRRRRGSGVVVANSHHLMPCGSIFNAESSPHDNPKQAQLKGNSSNQAV
jgi:hypothetical protein